MTFCSFIVLPVLSLAKPCFQTCRLQFLYHNVVDKRIQDRGFVSAQMYELKQLNTVDLCSLL